LYPIDAKGFAEFFSCHRDLPQAVLDNGHIDFVGNVVLTAPAGMI